MIVTFQGTSLDLVACTSNTKGKAKVTVDPGTAEATTDTVDLYSPSTLWKQTVYSTDVLVYGTHTVVIECLHQKNPASCWYTVDVDGSISWARSCQVRLSPRSTTRTTPTSPTPRERRGLHLDWSSWDNSGYWAAYQDTYAYTDKLGYKATFTFNGTYAAWVACTSNTKGKAQVSSTMAQWTRPIWFDDRGRSLQPQHPVEAEGRMTPASCTRGLHRGHRVPGTEERRPGHTIDVDRFDVMLTP